MASHLRQPPRSAADRTGPAVVLGGGIRRTPDLLTRTGLSRVLGLESESTGAAA